jgi:hypothetical protein
VTKFACFDPQTPKLKSSETALRRANSRNIGRFPSPGPIKDVPADKLRTMLGIANVTFKQNKERLAIIDAPLQS